MSYHVSFLLYHLKHILRNSVTTVLQGLKKIKVTKGQRRLYVLLNTKYTVVFNNLNAFEKQ